MFYITQSNDVNRLFERLLNEYQQKSEQIFEPFIVIVPSKVMGDWLKKQVADKAGISTLVTTEFWGRYQWTLMQAVLKQYAKMSPTPILRVPEVAVLSQSVMQWRLFGFFVEQKNTIISDTSHPLHAVIVPLLTQKNLTKSTTNQDTTDKDTTSQFDNPFIQSQMVNEQKTDEQRLWQLADDMARMLGRYMTYRPDWLERWGAGQSLPIAEMVAEKDQFFSELNHTSNEQDTPDWLTEQFMELEIAQRYIWQVLFHDTYAYRQTIETQFWQGLEHADTAIADACQAVLPKRIILFTLQQLPPTELKMMKSLAKYIDIMVLHYNPSQMFWADIVDKNWLLTQRFIHPETVYYKDFGHTLLSRFGKQSREVFAMLAYFAGNDDHTVWQDDFELPDVPATLLSQLQQDILMLQEQQTGIRMQEILDSEIKRAYQPTRVWQQVDLDNSLSIHACHSTLRQLEVIRSMIIGWLNYIDKPSQMPDTGSQIDFLSHAHGNTLRQDDRRGLSDILILLPDIEAQQNVIESVFPKGVGTDGYDLPAKVTGVVSKDINQLWSAMVGYFNLLNQSGARFDKATVFDWLMLPPLYESYGLSLEEMARACELLEMAGFIRGFDEIHLASSLHSQDDDYRFSFAFALERLVAGVLMPQAMSTEFGEYTNRHGERERILPLENVQLSDTPIVAVLTQIYQTLHRYRYSGEQLLTAEQWLEQIEAFIHEKFAVFEQTNALKAIWSAQNAFKQNIKANQRYENFSLTSSDVNVVKNNIKHLDIKPENLPLKLGFILSSMANELASQQVSAEPSGVITFGRIGAVRNLPYKLVIMLNLNLADFPNRDTSNRYDLMQAGLARQGDRFKEDDEMGAFLDAILSAKEACWLFYNGASVSDQHEHLPASPVQELIDFLSEEVTWQSKQPNQSGQSRQSKQATQPSSDSKANDSTENSVQTELNSAVNSELIRGWLTTRHPALPFANAYFYQEKQTANQAGNNADNHADSQVKNQTEKTTKSKKTAKPKKTKVTENNAENAIASEIFQTQPLAQLLNAEQQKTLLNTRIRRIKDQQKVLYPPAKVWHSVFEQLSHAAPTVSPPSRIELWQRQDLSAWLTAWQAHKESLKTPHQGSDVHNHDGQNTVTNTANTNTTSEHILLDFVIKAVQTPAQHFIRTHQIRLAQSVEADTSNEPLELDSLANYQLNAYLIEQIKAQASPVDKPQRLSQKLALLPFSNELPAGVSRHLILKTQQKKLETACASLLQKIQPTSLNNNIKASTKTSTKTSDHTQTIPPAALARLTSAIQEQGINTASETHATTTIAQLLTPCQEQRIGVAICRADFQRESSNLPTAYHVILTANLPVFKQKEKEKPVSNPTFWVQYLPTNGKEKYQVQMWLYHLCWQVLRHTTDEQVQMQDGFSLWQYGTASTLYLPPIAHGEAYSYLQDWLMAWQLYGEHLMLIPPSVTVRFLNEIQKRQAKNEFTPNDIPKLIADAGWKKDSYGSYISEDSPDHATWQFLLAGQNAERAITPFLQTLGAWLYTPILDNLLIIN